MNPRLKAIASCMAISSLLLSACASSPPTSSGTSVSSNEPAPIDTTALPRLMLPGANMAEVKALAMGAARSRGWTVRQTDSTADRLVVERPAEALVAPGPGVGPGATLEVTTLLKDYGTGIEVATLAEVVTPPQAGRPATRLDYTEHFRQALTQSLASLQERWARDRDRVARATPPAEGWNDAWNPSPAPAVDTAYQPPATPPRPTPVAPAQAWTPPPAPRVETAAGSQGASAPQVRSSLTTSTADNRGLTPSGTRYNPSGAAPIVDASATLTPRPAVSAAPPVTAAAPPAGDTMMSLPQTPPIAAARPSRARWSVNAEQYARQRGCQVTVTGSQLIESRQDGEVFKVPCQGSDSFLVHCRDGLCQGLL